MIQVKLFRQKPVQAVFLNKTNAESIRDWMEAQGWHGARTGHLGCLLIDTLEGEMVAAPGDWIVRGPQGEFQPMKSDIFTRTYDPY